MSERVVWQPNPGPQSDFLACSSREALFGGSVGAGKTDALLMCAVSQTGNGKHRALILRRTFPMLRDLIGRSHELFLPLGAVFNKGSSQWTFPSGAIVEFGFCDAFEDVYRYMGRAFSFIGFDELTSWPGDARDDNGQPVSSAYVYLLSRLRAVEGTGLRLEVRATCTPGGIGHTFVQNRWQIPPDGSASEVTDPQTGFTRTFIPGRISSNPYLHNTTYERSLAALPETTRKGLLLGRWDVFEGAVFSEWNPLIHVCDPFPIPFAWPIWRGADDGHASPACVLWFAHDKIHDRLYVVQELYASRLTPEYLAAEVLAIDELLRPGARLDGVIDSASFADVGMGGGRADKMNARGCRWEPCEKGSNSRLAGWAAIHSRLALKADGHPGLVVFRTCRALIRTLPALTYSKRHPEDVDDSCEDHAPDALRYGLDRKPNNFRLVRVGGI